MRREVIFEFTPIGTSVKVTALDVTTDLEVSVVAPSSASRNELERIALQKLRYMLNRQGETDSDAKKPGDREEPGGGGGIVV
ncbi:serine hydroxymethyltransferase [Parvibaculum sp.]|uniref:DUF6898 family protein n=1 Tax=Parvibaculum sp. TaxID=2024848 RepID=UPI001D5058D0|nr:serine hydroxymethyltransferase [Parvibaculum sp.]MBX3488094.1 serine hydroxymethyltransferase [Parvibaculum sp.]MCW5727928.1 serine hydroxymethyltransferase [Parvibaculum sp.]